MLLTLIIILLVLGLLFGWFGSPQYGYGVGWSPLAVIIVVLLILWAMGRLVF
jgi:hypothetical protein